MNEIKGTIGTGIGVAMIVGFTALILGLVLSLAAEQLPVIKTIGSELRCLTGFPEEGSRCWINKLAALDDQRRALEEEKERLGHVIAAQSFVFTQGVQLKDGVTLVVGTLYQDAAAKRGVIRSFCWIVVDSGGLDPRVGLAVMDGDGSIEDLKPDAADLAQLAMTASDVSTARAACPFPEVP